MADKILHKRNLTPGTVPTTASLSVGELAINVADGKLFLRQSGSAIDNIIQVGLSASYAATTSFAPDYVLNSATSSMLQPYVLTSSTSSMSVLSSSYANTASYIQTAQTASYVLQAVSSSFAATASYYQETDPVFTAVSGTFTTTASFNAFTASYNTASFSGSFTGNLIGTASWAEYSVTASYFSGSIANAITAETASYVLQAVSASYAPDTTFPYTGSAVITGSLEVIGSIQATSFTGSLLGTASYYQETDPIFVAKSASLATTGSNVFIGSQIISGSLQLNPTTDPGGSNTTSSFFFVTSSGDNTEYNLHYRNSGALWETHWLEERTDTGLVWGGILTFTNTTMSITPGAGLIVNHNANTGSHGDTVPTYVEFGPITASATFITSSQVTYLLIDETGNLVQQTSPFTPQQYNEKFPLGYIFCLTTSSISSYADARVTTYGQDEQQSQFIRAFGPLKVSGYDITAQTGSLKITIASGRTYRAGGFYTQDPENPSVYDSTTVPTGSLVRIYRDPAVIGGFRAATNAGVPFTDIDPTKWDDGTGTLQTVTSNQWTIQRVFQGVVNNISYVYYGQNTYDSLNAAIQSITTEAFEESPTSIIALPFIGYIITRGNATDLGDTTNNKIINSGLFRNTAGASGGGGIATTNLNDLSDVTISSPSTGQALVYSAGNWINSNPASASYASTASYVETAQTASYILQAVSASFSTTASYILNAISSSFASTASNVSATGNAFIQNGNSFGTTAVLGTNDAQSLQLETNNIVRVTVSGSGEVGIGASPNPNSKLIVAESAKNYAIIGTNTTNNGAGILGQAVDSATGTIFGVYGLANSSAATNNIGLVGQAGFGSNNYSIQLIDGSQGIGKVLVSQTSDGKANWSSRLSGAYEITGSLTVTQGITGSFLGTASYATQALSASYAPDTTFPYTGSAIVSGSLRVTGSFSVLDDNGFNNINTAVRSLYAGGNGVISLDWTNRVLTNSSGITVVDWRNYRLIDTSTTRSIDWQNRTLLDTSQANVFNWSNGQALWSNRLSLDWQNRKLYDTSPILSADWASRSLYDTSTTQSADWQNRRLVDSTSVQSADWQNRYTIDASGIVSTNWDTRRHYDTSTSSSILWSSRTLNDSSEFTSVDWETRQTFDVSNNISSDWNSRALYDANGISSVDWNARTLVGSIGNGVFAWDVYANYYTTYTNYYHVQDITDLDLFSQQTATTFAALTQNISGEVIPASNIIDAGVSIGNLVYLNSDGIWYKTDQTSVSSSYMLGVCVENASGKERVFLEGNIGFTTSSVANSPLVTGTNFYGVPIYISGSDGAMSTEKPTSGVVRIVGHAFYNSTTTPTNWLMKFRPSNDWYEI